MGGQSANLTLSKLQMRETIMSRDIFASKADGSAFFDRSVASPFLEFSEPYPDGDEHNTPERDAWRERYREWIGSDASRNPGYEPLADSCNFSNGNYAEFLDVAGLYSEIYEIDAFIQTVALIIDRPDEYIQRRAVDVLQHALYAKAKGCKHISV